jgi:chromosome segregation protein
VKNYKSGREIYNKLGFKGKCVTLTGEQIISYKYAYETPFVKRLKGFLSAATQREQSDVLESEIKSINDEISKLRVDQSQIDTKQREIFKRKETFSDLLYIFHQKQRITAKKNKLYAQMHELEKENSRLKENVKETEVKISELKKQTDPDFFQWNERINEIPPILASLNKEKKKWEVKFKENSDIAIEVAEELNQHKSELNAKKLEHEKLKEDFQKSDKDAFETYRELENTEDMINKSEESVLKSKEVKNQYQIMKFEIEKQSIQTTIQLEQENVKLNSMNQDLSTKEDDLARIESEIGPLFSDQVVKVRPREEINEDIQNVDKKLLNYLDVDDSLLIEKDQIIISLKELNKNRESIEHDIKAAIRTETQLEKTYYKKYSGVLESLQTKVNKKFEDSQIKSYCSLELTGNFENLGVNIKAATSKEQLKSFTALSGGQVSLISICLILSLQEIKPSPLCMLDEAGMFLDEKNSEVAYQLIKSTLKQNPIQLFMFLPKSSSSLFLLAEKIIGIARVGKKEISSVFKPKIITKK